MRASSVYRYYSRAIFEGDAVPKRGTNAMPKQSPMKKEMYDDHDNRAADYCDEWVSYSEEASHIVTDCYENGWSSL